MDSSYRNGLMVSTRTHGIDIDSWYSIGTLESDKYERAECCPYAGFFILLNRIYLDIEFPYCRNKQIMFAMQHFILTSKHFEKPSETTSNTSSLSSKTFLLFISFILFFHMSNLGTGLTYNGLYAICNKYFHSPDSREVLSQVH